MLLSLRRLFPLVACVLTAGIAASSAQANGHLRAAETVYVAPTTYLAPTSSLLATSYLLPATYTTVVPTAYTTYVPTAYTATEYYYPTAIYRVRRPRTYVVERPIYTTRAYVAAPTYYVTRRPVLIDEGVVTTSYVSTDCDYAAPMPAVGKATPGSASETSGKKAIKSSPRDGAGQAGSDGTSDAESPPNTDANGPLNVPPPNPQGGRERSSYKPAARRLAVLDGRVIDSATKDPVDAVEVVVSEKLSRFSDRTAKTDAKGRFAVALPEGDWVVKATLPDKKMTTGKDVTVSAGFISDPDGKEIATLVVER